MADVFQVRIAVRGYELDLQGHVNQAVYLQYGEHSRWQCFHAAGLTPEVLVGAGVGPVVLETTIRYLKELPAGDEVEVDGHAGADAGSGQESGGGVAERDGDPAGVLAQLGDRGAVAGRPVAERPR